jgi:hypothetical protein
VPMAAAGGKEKKGWIDWRVFWIVLLVILLLPLLALFVAAVLIQPGDADSALGFLRVLSQ